MPFDKSRIADAVFKAGLATRGCDLIMATILAEEISEAVVVFVRENYDGRSPRIVNVQDIVEKLLIATGHRGVAKRLNMDGLKPAAPDSCFRGTGLEQTQAKQAEG